MFSVSRIFISAIFVIISSSYMTGNNIAEEYIQRYQAIAVSEMERSGIPASIKLAQGILESNSGRSSLSRQSFNHFGIKCGKNWKGKVFYIEDDDYINGKKIKSCFRVFDSPEDSYIAHTEFLGQKRYRFLFELDKTDYKSWAKGLRKAGYATDKKYPQKLISIIEKYELHQYDITQENVIEVYADREDDPKDRENIIDYKYTKPRQITQQKTFGVEHMVLHGETMQSIAQAHHIDLEDLYIQNRLPVDSQPIPGERIKLDGYVHWGRRAKFKVANSSDEFTSGAVLFADDSELDPFVAVNLK